MADDDISLFKRICDGLFAIKNYNVNLLPWNASETGVANSGSTDSSLQLQTLLRSAGENGDRMTSEIEDYFMITRADLVEAIVFCSFLFGHLQYTPIAAVMPNSMWTAATEDRSEFDRSRRATMEYRTLHELYQLLCFSVDKNAVVDEQRVREIAEFLTQIASKVYYQMVVRYMPEQEDAGGVGELPNVRFRHGCALCLCECGNSVSHFSSSFHLIRLLTAFHLPLIDSYLYSHWLSLLDVNTLFSALPRFVKYPTVKKGEKQRKINVESLKPLKIFVQPNPAYWQTVYRYEQVELKGFQVQCSLLDVDNNDLYPLILIRIENFLEMRAADSKWHELFRSDKRNQERTVSIYVRMQHSNNTIYPPVSKHHRTMSVKDFLAEIDRKSDTFKREIQAYIKPKAVGTFLYSGEVVVHFDCLNIFLSVPFMVKVICRLPRTHQVALSLAIKDNHFSNPITLNSIMPAALTRLSFTELCQLFNFGSKQLLELFPSSSPGHPNKFTLLACYPHNAADSLIVTGQTGGVLRLREAETWAAMRYLQRLVLNQAVAPYVGVVCSSSEQVRVLRLLTTGQTRSFHERVLIGTVGQVQLSSRDCRLYLLCFGHSDASPLAAADAAEPEDDSALWAFVLERLAVNPDTRFVLLARAESLLMSERGQSVLRNVLENEAIVGAHASGLVEFAPLLSTIVHVAFKLHCWDKLIRFLSSPDFVYHSLLNVLSDDRAAGSSMFSTTLPH